MTFPGHKTALLLIALLLTGTAAAADDQARQLLRDFVSSADSFSAVFDQQLLDEEGELLEESSGEFWLQRPGKFRWDYRQPYQQSIIANGKTLWVYDVDLEQVTVKPMDQAFGSAPVLLLDERADLERDFELQDLGSSDNLEWVELTPRQQEADFSRIAIGFSAERIAVMDLHDSFGQTTQIRFNDLKIDQPVTDAQVEFTPPAGVDVVGQQQ